MKTPIIEIQESEISTSDAFGFVCAVSGRDWRGWMTDENPAAHGNITVTETHTPTGVWRNVNINGHFREEGPWRKTVDNSGRIASLTRQLASIEQQIVADLQRASKDGMKGKANPGICRDLAKNGPIWATNCPVYAYLAKTADLMDDHNRIEAQIETLKQQEGSFPVAAKIVEAA